MLCWKVKSSLALSLPTARPAPNMCMWTLEPIGVGSNHIPHEQLLLGPLLRPRSVPTDSTALDTGSGPLGQGTVGTWNIFRKWAERSGL